MASGSIENVFSRIFQFSSGFAGNCNELDNGVVLTASSGTTNAPVTGTSFFIITLRFNAGYATQIALKRDSAAMYFRQCANSTWGSWTQTATQ